MTHTADFIIIGAGILGLSLARELKTTHPDARIIILEKENQIGLHGSGRNSGVLHSGIYYPEGSLKAKLCLEGNRQLAAYCDAHHLPISRIGKVILPTKTTDDSILQTLYQRATHNGAEVKLIDEAELREIEPAAHTATGRALFCPETAVVDSKAILKHLHQSLLQQQVSFYFNSRCSQINPQSKTLKAGNKTFSYGHLFNTAGLYADVVAKACGMQERFTMIPFKGSYFELSNTSSLQINHLIYPVPDMNVPFLGIHFTKNTNNRVYIGPSAIPAFGRENYQRLEGARIKESLATFATLGRQYCSNQQGFRTYTHREVARFIPKNFVAAAQALVPQLTFSDLKKSEKVGIRAQLFDQKKRELVMDFLIKSSQNETHVLNAVSPGFTSAFSFSQYIVQSFSKTFASA